MSSMRTPLSALISCLSLTAAWKAKTGHGPTPHAHSQVYFKLQDACDPALPPQPLFCISSLSHSQLTAEAVCFDKWQGRPGFLLSCRHIVDSSVWSRTMCSAPARNSGYSLHPKWQHPHLHTCVPIQINICKFNLNGCSSILWHF